MAPRMALFKSTSGSPPSSVPAGQMSLQKVGSALAHEIGEEERKQNHEDQEDHIFELPEELIAAEGSDLLKKGILCKRSWIRPKGQRKPQTRRPRIAPTKIRKPMT